MSIASGTRFDRYEILAPLGAGGMGEVYLAQDLKLGRKVALKLLPAAFTREATRLRRFEQEARAASALNHPNIITIHEIGESDGEHFITTEFIEGETLRQRLHTAKLPPATAINIATQIAAALAAAHTAGIVHRDIKPENVMLRRDGYVKVLDFGLAKLTEKLASTPAIDSEAATLAKVNTDPGTVVGTPQYMSPEQARGEELDGRSDIFSLGIVLYEMLTRRAPFEGVNALDVVSAILRTEPTPLRQHTLEVNRELEKIVGKALRKDREERYQHIKDMLIDLNDLRREMEFEEKLARVQSAPTVGEAATIPNNAQAGGTTTQVAAADTRGAASVTTISSTKIILGEIKRHRLGLIITLAVIALAAVASLFYFNRKPILTERDTVLLADFDNKTGDEVFDGALKQALAVQLGQSPFLNIFSDERVRDALRLMNRSPEERVTRDVGREICQRQGLKALLTGSIGSLGRNYVLSLDAINAQTGDVLAREQVEAEGKEQVLRTLGAAAKQLREKLGESLSSIQKFDKPIEQATTSSLEALRFYSQAWNLSERSAYEEAIPLYRKAIELDPNFALANSRLATAYRNSGQLDAGIEFARKAFELRERASEFEKFPIALEYYTTVTREFDKQMEVAKQYKQAYPRSTNARNSLGNRYSANGEDDKAIDEYTESIRLNPDRTPDYGNLAIVFMRLNRFDEAKEVIERAQQRQLDQPRHHTTLYQLAFIRGDKAEMQRQIEWAMGTTDQHVAFGWQASTAAFAGQKRQAREFIRRAVELAERRKLKVAAAGLLAQGALSDAVVGLCQQVRADTARALALSRDQNTLMVVALALARCEPDQALQLADEFSQRFNANQGEAAWPPLIRASVELRRGNAAQALQLLQPVVANAAAGATLASFRGRAYLQLNKGTEAATEFQKILDHRGWAPFSQLHPLAHLGLARVAVLQDDAAKARKSYQDFFALWKDADADLPILIEAKKEYEKLK